MDKPLIKKYCLALSVFCFCLQALSQQHEVSQLKKWELSDYALSAMAQNDAYSAMLFYTELLKREPNNNKHLYDLALAHYKLRNYDEALGLFRRLIEANETSVMATIYLSKCLMHQEEYEEARQLLRKMRLEQRKGNANTDNRFLIDNLYNSCNYALSLQDSLANFELTMLNEGVNHKHKEFNPFLLNDSLLVYGSCVLNAIKFGDESSGPKFHFYQSQLIDNEWEGGVLASQPFYNYEQSHTGDGCFSLDKRRFYFSKAVVNSDGKQVYHLFVTILENDTWSEPIQLGSDINQEFYSTMQPTVGTCYDPDLEVLYFISDRKGGIGNTDIWYSIYNAKTKTYTKSINAGIFINTEGYEITPHYDLSTHTMYFSSDGWVGLGGVDVFAAIGETTNWQTPNNVGIGINTSYDDQDFYIANRGDNGFITSNRPSPIYLTTPTCCDNIYSWKRQLNTKRKVKGQLMQTMYQIGSLSEVSVNKTDSVIPLKKIPLNVFIKKDTLDYVFIDKIVTDELGRFEYLAPIDYQLKLVIDDPSVLDKEITLDANANSDSDVLIKTKPIKTLPREAIVLNNIYYETNKYTLTQESKSNIDSTLLRLLREYDDLSIEIISHTDNQGTSKYNLRLSQKRAGSVVKYLINKGIARHRLIAVGKGESEPIADNTNADGSDNPDGRSLNRRTEFKVHHPD